MLALCVPVLLLLDAIFMRDANEAKESELGGTKGVLLASFAGLFLLFALAAAGADLTSGMLESAGSRVATHNAMLIVDPLASLAMTLLCGGGLLALLLAVAFLPRANIHHSEYYPLLLLSIAGALAVVCAGNLISLFVAIELMSLPVYVLVGFDRDRAPSNAAGLKALLTGAFASGLSLYGIALIYGATGHFDYPGIRDAFDRDLPLALAGVALVLAGLLARLGVAPFHQWLPDVTAGAPAAVSAFIPIAIVTASTFALIRILDSLVPDTVTGVRVALQLLSGVSMAVGCSMALVETNVKRILAYAGIAQMGFLLVALTVPTVEGTAAALLQAVVFLFMQFGALGAVSSMSLTGVGDEEVSDCSGLAVRRPILAATSSLFLLALAGLPGTAGFISRFVVMSVAIDDGQIFLTLAMGIASVALFAAYLRIPTAMYIGGVGREEAPAASLSVVIALAICAFIAIYLGLFPGQGPLPVDTLEIVRRAALP